MLRLFFRVSVETEDFSEDAVKVGVLNTISGRKTAGKEKTAAHKYLKS